MDKEKLKVSSRIRLELPYSFLVLSSNSCITQKDMINWTKKKSGPATHTAASKEDIDTFTAKKNSVVGFFEKDSDGKISILHNMVPSRVLR